MMFLLPYVINFYGHNWAHKINVSQEVGAVSTEVVRTQYSKLWLNPRELKKSKLGTWTGAAGS